MASDIPSEDSCTDPTPRRISIDYTFLTNIQHFYSDHVVPVMRPHGVLQLSQVEEVSTVSEDNSPRSSLSTAVPDTGSQGHGGQDLTVTWSTPLEAGRGRGREGRRS